MSLRTHLKSLVNGESFLKYTPAQQTVKGNNN